MDNGPLIFISIARWVLGVIFLIAATTKWLNLSSFQLAVSRLPIVRRDWLFMLTRGLASIELLVGSALILNWYPQVAAGITSALLLSFIGVLGIQFRRGEKEGCGCFGSSTGEKLRPWVFVRNSLLSGLSLLVCLAPVGSWNPWPVPLILFVVALATAKWLTDSKHGASQNQTVGHQLYLPKLSRRDFLRRLGWVSVGVLGQGLLDRSGIKPVLADSPCPCTQTYSHWEPWCYTSGCSFPNRRHHVWTRSCEPCYCGCGSSCRSAWCCCTCTCEPCAYQCDTITPNCGCPCTWCDPCTCSDGGGDDYVPEGPQIKSLATISADYRRIVRV